MDARDAQVLVSYLPGPLNAVKDSLADKAVAGEEPRRFRSHLARSRDGCCPEHRLQCIGGQGFVSSSTVDVPTVSRPRHPDAAAVQSVTMDRHRVVLDTTLLLQSAEDEGFVIRARRNFHRQLEAEVRAKFAPFARRFNFQRTMASLAGKDLKACPSWPRLHHSFCYICQ